MAVLPGADAGLVALRIGQDPERSGPFIGDEGAAGGQRGRNSLFGHIVGDRDIEMESVAVAPQRLAFVDGLEPQRWALTSWVGNGVVVFEAVVEHGGPERPDGIQVGRIDGKLDPLGGQWNSGIAEFRGTSGDGARQPNVGFAQASRVVRGHRDTDSAWVTQVDVRMMILLVGKGGHERCELCALGEGVRLKLRANHVQAEAPVPHLGERSELSRCDLGGKHARTLARLSLLSQRGSVSGSEHSLRHGHVQVLDHLAVESDHALARRLSLFERSDHGLGMLHLFS